MKPTKNSRKKLVVVFDLDDTLWHCHRNYVRSMNSFGRYMESILGCQREEAIDLFCSIDEEWSKERGLHGARWLESMFSTMGLLFGKHGRQIKGEMMAEVEKIAAIPWECPILFPDTEEILNSLEERGIPMYGFSAGDTKQQIKIQKLRKKGFDLDRIFYSTFFVMKKDVSAHKAFLADIRKKYPEAMVAFVGDSIVNDIVPSIAAGYDLSVWIDRGFHWPPRKNDKDGKWPVARSLSEALSIVEKKFNSRKGN